VVVPSAWYEGLPTAIIESFAHRRPVVSTSIGGAASLVDESVAFLATATAESVAEALCLAAEPTVAARRGAAARVRFLEKFTRSRIRDALVRTYLDESTCASRSPLSVGR
jgi:glycosyltransferase involved in cell wall biosynthesis